MENTEIKQKAFRNAMSRMGAAVNIITSNGVAGCCGITATAVCSVSDSPPTVLVCLNRASAMNRVFKENGALCINVLSAEQEEHARDFAGMTGVPMEERFLHPTWGEGAGQLPVLGNALVNLIGKIIRTEEVGSHTIMIAEIEDMHFSEGASGALVYFDRLFHRLPQQLATA